MVGTAVVVGVATVARVALGVLLGVAIGTGVVFAVAVSAAVALGVLLGLNVAVLTTVTGSLVAS